jgi:alcohol dehydrogenase YqhD (iron-dependent ADH family)
MRWPERQAQKEIEIMFRIYDDVTSSDAETIQDAIQELDTWLFNLGEQNSDFDYKIGTLPGMLRGEGAEATVADVERALDRIRQGAGIADNIDWESSWPQIEEV